MEYTEIILGVDQKKDLLENLHHWALDAEVENDPYVVGIYSAIEKDENLSMWSTLSPLQYLPTPRAKSGEFAMNLGKFISILRNILVFVPVALTWKSVGEATTAFSIFIEKNNATTVNFLEFWQNGYQILDSKWIIGKVAEIDFLIIILVIALSLLSSLLMSSAASATRSKTRVLGSERVALSLALSSYLYGRRPVKSTNFTEDMSEAAENLLATTKALSDSTTNIKTLIDDIPKVQELQGKMSGFYRWLAGRLEDIDE